MSPNIQFESRDRPPGFRAIAGGRVSTGASGLLIGLNAAAAPEPLAKQAEAMIDQSFCVALFGRPDPSLTDVRIASFSDYFCPYCRILTPFVARIAAEPGARMTVAWHEYPILGQTSRIAARAALAARRQGAYSAFQQRMFRTIFQPTPAYLAELCRALGIDFKRLQSDMDSEEVSLELAESAALARRFGFYGPPDLVAGKTVVEGAADERLLWRLIEIERKERLGDLCTIA